MATRLAIPGWPGAQAQLEGAKKVDPPPSLGGASPPADACRLSATRALRLCLDALHDARSVLLRNFELMKAFDDHDLREQCCQRVALEAENETVAVVSQCLHPFLIHAGPSDQVHSWRPSRKTAQC